MKKVLYLMNIEWGWIKQRPHFIAEELSEIFNVTIVCAKHFDWRNHVNNPVKHNVRIKNLFRIPMERLPIGITKINKILFKKQLVSLIPEYDIIWFCSPQYMDSLPLYELTNKMIIYDCMDDHLEFPGVKSNKYLRNLLFQKEYTLYKRADVIFSSSDYLKNILISRYGEKRITVVNNAIPDFSEKTIESYLPESMNIFKNCINKKIVYIGTIAEWIDFELLRKIINSLNGVEIFLFGPGPKHYEERIHFMGPVEHKYVTNILSNSDILIMPFVLTELIQSVNPVKLYEYIYSGKPSLAPSYFESEKFKEYVFLYHNQEECVKLIDEIFKGITSSKSIEDCRRFCLNNTWRKRVNEICKTINDCIVTNN